MLCLSLILFLLLSMQIHAESPINNVGFDYRSLDQVSIIRTVNVNGTFVDKETFSPGDAYYQTNANLQTDFSPNSFIEASKFVIVDLKDEEKLYVRFKEHHINRSDPTYSLSYLWMSVKNPKDSLKSSYLATRIKLPGDALLASVKENGYTFECTIMNCKMWAPWTSYTPKPEHRLLKSKVFSEEEKRVLKIEKDTKGFHDLFLDIETHSVLTYVLIHPPGMIEKYAGKIPEKVSGPYIYQTLNVMQTHHVFTKCPVHKFIESWGFTNEHTFTEYKYNTKRPRNFTFDDGNAKDYALAITPVCGTNEIDINCGELTMKFGRYESRIFLNYKIKIQKAGSDFNKRSNFKIQDASSFVKENFTGCGKLVRSPVYYVSTPVKSGQDARKCNDYDLFPLKNVKEHSLRDRIYVYEIEQGSIMESTDVAIHPTCIMALTLPRITSTNKFDSGDRLPGNSELGGIYILKDQLNISISIAPFKLDVASSLQKKYANFYTPFIYHTCITSEDLALPVADWEKYECSKGLFLKKDFNSYRYFSMHYYKHDFVDDLTQKEFEALIDPIKPIAILPANNEKLFFSLKKLETTKENTLVSCPTAFKKFIGLTTLVKMVVTYNSSLSTEWTPVLSEEASAILGFNATEKEVHTNDLGKDYTCTYQITLPETIESHTFMVKYNLGALPDLDYEEAEELPTFVPPVGRDVNHVTKVPIIDNCNGTCESAQDPPVDFKQMISAKKPGTGGEDPDEMELGTIIVVVMLVLLLISCFCSFFICYPKYANRKIRKQKRFAVGNSETISSSSTSSACKKEVKTPGKKVGKPTPLTNNSKAKCRISAKSSDDPSNIAALSRATDVIITTKKPNTMAGGAGSIYADGKVGELPKIPQKHESLYAVPKTGVFK
uniref:Ig-like domain-containing protein n=1 Tax=Rhabditophanes sp. KR3021 TaxID=114890 RepID=A0AC35UF12_9BILA